jgi:hypothetical protein
MSKTTLPTGHPELLPSARSAHASTRLQRSTRRNPPHTGTSRHQHQDEHPRDHSLPDMSGWTGVFPRAGLDASSPPIGCTASWCTRALSRMSANSNNHVRTTPNPCRPKSVRPWRCLLQSSGPWPSRRRCSRRCNSFLGCLGKQHRTTTTVAVTVAASHREFSDWACAE